RRGGARALRLRPGHQQPHAITKWPAISDSSLPGLTRQSILFRKNFFAKEMDARVKPAHDVVERCELEPIASHRREEIGPGALLELAAGFGAEANGGSDGAVTLRLDDFAAIGLGNQAAKREPTAGDGGITRNRRAAGTFEHGEKGAFGGQCRGGRGVTDGEYEIEHALVVAARLNGDDPLPDS